MAKKSFGRGSIADLVREAEEMQKEQEEQAAAIASTGSTPDVSELLQAQKSNPAQDAKVSVGVESSPDAPELLQAQENNPVEESAVMPTESAERIDNGQPEQPDDIAVHTHLSASDLLSKEHAYKNTTRQVNISEDFYVFLRAISKQCDISIAQIVNNMLRPYLTDKSLKKEIKSLARKRFNEAISKVDEIE